MRICFWVFWNIGLFLGLGCDILMVHVEVVFGGQITGVSLCPMDADTIPCFSH